MPQESTKLDVARVSFEILFEELREMVLDLLSKEFRKGLAVLKGLMAFRTMLCCAGEDHAQLVCDLIALCDNFLLLKKFDEFAFERIAVAGKDAILCLNQSTEELRRINIWVPKSL